MEGGFEKRRGEEREGEEKRGKWGEGVKEREEKGEGGGVEERTRKEVPLSDSYL